MSNLPTPIDYTNLGYGPLREAMLALARERLPEWTDQSVNDIGVILVELFAYACDITLYYQNRLAANLMPATSDDPAALVQLLRLIGYELHPPAPSMTKLRLVFDPTVAVPITIPAGTRLDAILPSGEAVPFETVEATTISGSQLANITTERGPGRAFYPLSVVQGQTVNTELLGTSDGTPNQLFSLRQKPVLAGSLTLSTNEPGGVVAFWQEVESLAQSTPADRHCVLQRSADGTATIRFGDGINGTIPPRGDAREPGTIFAVYRIGGGPQGNVAAGRDFRLQSPLPNGITLQSATNPDPAAGGVASEDLARARSIAPRLFRTQDRAVTAQDYTDLALQVPGVGKARAVATSWNEVTLYIAPSGQVTEPSEILVQNLLGYFERFRILSSTVRVLGPTPAEIYLRADVVAKPFFRSSDVRNAIEQAVQSYLEFDAVDFGQPIYLSRVYDLIQSLPQVVSLNITHFSRTPFNTVTGGVVESSGVLLLGPRELPRAGYGEFIQLRITGSVR